MPEKIPNYGQGLPKMAILAPGRIWSTADNTSTLIHFFPSAQLLGVDGLQEFHYCDCHRID